MLTAAERRHFWLRKLHSLSGLVPIGGYLFFHLFENAGVLVSPDLFERNAKFIESFDFLIAPIEALLIGSNSMTRHGWIWLMRLSSTSEPFSMR